MDDAFNSLNQEKYLLYQLGTDWFATPLIEVREVIEYRQAKPIPHTAAFFRGVINLRGEIIGVMDLRERLGISTAAAPVALLIFETEQGPLAAVVDKVMSVTVIAEADLERRASAHAQSAERAYLIGVGKVEDKLLTVISLRKILTAEQMSGMPAAGAAT